MGLDTELDQNDTERLFEKMPHTGECTLRYFAGLRQSAYIIPVTSSSNGIMETCLNSDGIKMIFPFGFLRTYGFMNKEFLDLKADGTINKTEKPTEGQIYVPLHLTFCTREVGIADVKPEDKTISEGSPYNLYGLKGWAGLLPVYLVSSTSEGPVMIGLFKKKNSTVCAFSAGNELSFLLDKMGDELTSLDRIVSLEQRMSSSTDYKLRFPSSESKEIVWKNNGS